MRRWTERSHEERHLLNPAFCSAVLWYAAKGAAARAIAPKTSLSFTEAFLILPLVLHEKSRESLPSRISTSLPVWINSNPLIVAALPMRTKLLVSYTKEAITFGGSAQLFSLEGNEIISTPAFNLRLKTTFQEASKEVRECMKKAEFLGKWFAHTGAPETIFTLFGIRL